jgi:hypothetical protein
MFDASRVTGRSLAQRWWDRWRRDHSLFSRRSDCEFMLIVVPHRDTTALGRADAPTEFGFRSPVWRQADPDA